MQKINIEQNLAFIRENNPYFFEMIDTEVYNFKNQGIYELFVNCYAHYLEKNGSTMRWEVIFAQIFNGFTSSEFRDLLQNVSKDKLSRIDYITLASVLIEGKNIYDLSDLYDLENSTSVKYNQLSDIIAMIRSGRNIDSIKNAFSCVDQRTNNLEELIKDLIFRKAYNLDYTSATALLQSFGSDLSNIKGIDQKLVDLVVNISIISKIKDIDSLVKIFESVKLASVNMMNYKSLDRGLASSFQNIYGANCYKKNKKDLKGYLQNGIPVFEIIQSFIMCVSSLGGVFQNSTRDYVADWNNRKDAFISTSLIGNRNMNTCPIRNVCYGFSEFEPLDILDAGTMNLHVSDLGGLGNPQSNFRSGKVNHVKYCMPQKFLGDTLTEGKNEYGCWNEIAYRRFDEDGKRIMPSYIVYFSEGEMNKDDEIWKNSILAAEQFGIPIVIINKKKIKEYNQTTSDPDIIIPLEIKFDNEELNEINKSVSRVCVKLLKSSINEQIFEEDYSEKNDLEDSYIFDDPVYLELFKRYNMQEASEEERRQFEEKYMKAKIQFEEERVENIESMDQIGPRR